MSKIYKSIVSKYFEDFSIGDKYEIPSRTQTSAIFTMFQAASGDNEPIHYYKEFCKKNNALWIDFYYNTSGQKLPIRSNFGEYWIEGENEENCKWEIYDNYYLQYYN